MNSFSAWMASPVLAQYLVPAIWIVLLFSMSFTVLQVWRTWCYSRRIQIRAKASAQSMARLAVFDSWIRSGGRTNALEEYLELELRNEWAEKAKHHGNEYYRAFCAAEEQADQELIAVIKRLGGVITHGTDTTISG